MAGDKREKLLDFLDQKAFDPVLRASPSAYRTEHERKMLEDVRQSTESEKRRFHDDYRSARDVRDNFMSDLHSQTGKRISQELDQLNLPSLPKLREEFLDLCNQLGV
jgi:hypothetical protein